jgi:serine/threonine-protein kinase
LNEDADTADVRARARVGGVLDDKWTLERLLGVGGMAAVYAARHRNGARGAVKLLHPDLARHREVRERFLREGYAANRVDHPGAVKVLDDDVVASGPSMGTAYLVMELLEGQSMQDRLERGPAMSELEFLRIAESVLDVLKVAHARGVVHRDLKPENLFLVRPEAAAGAGASVKILDFGLARLLDGQAITTYGLALGTPSFMSPEQAAGRLDEIDGRTDLFALAATGFRLRTGRRLHEAANAVELVQKMATLPAPPIRSLARDVSEPYARVIDRALSFRRDDRYADADAMQRDVRKALSELDVVGPTQLAVPATRSPEPSAGEREPTTLEMSRRDVEPPRPVRRRRSLLPWVALLFFGGIGARLYLDATSPKTTPADDATGARVDAVDAGAPAPPPAAPAPAIADAAAAEKEDATPRSEEPSRHTSGVAAPSPAASHATAAPTALPSGAPAHPRVSPKSGPANVHKLGPHKRYTQTPKTAGEK